MWLTSSALFNYTMVNHTRDLLLPAIMLLLRGTTPAILVRLRCKDIKKYRKKQEAGSNNRPFAQFTRLIV